MGSGDLRFNASVHGLRGLASLLVVLFHVWAGAFEGGFLPEGTPPGIRYGLLSLQFGVELFFMISGYLISGSIVRHGDAGRFLLDRVIRIYPAFLPLLTLIFVLGPVAGYAYFAGVGPGQWLALFVANTLFLPGLAPIQPALIVAWTLSYEAAFYLFAALVYAGSSRAPMATTLIAVPCAALAIALFPRCAFFALGALVYYAPLRPGLSRLLGWLGPAALAALFAALLFISEPRFPAALAQGPAVLAAAGLSLVAGWALFAGLERQAGVLSRLLSSAPFQFLGTISYSLYLWHTPIMFATKRLCAHFFQGFGPEWVLATFAVSSFALALIAAWGSYRLFEVRGGRIARELLMGQASSTLRPSRQPGA